MTPDREHIQRCLDGFPNDFRFLVERYQGAVYAFVTTRIADRDHAREATAEAFVRAYLALPKLRNPEAFHSWLLGIAGRVALEFHRARQHHGAERGEIPEEPVETDAEEPATELDQAIAALLDTPLGTVTKTLSRAYEGLRAALAAQREAEKLEEMK